VFLGLIVLALMKLIPEMADSISELIGKSKSVYGSIINNLNSLNEKFPDIDFSNIIDTAKENLPTILANVGDILKVSLPKIFSTSYSIVQLLINILLAVAISIYMVCDKRRIAAASTKLIYSLLKPEKAEKVIENAKESFQIFTGFIIGKSIDSLIIGILTFFILTVFQLKYSLLVAVIVGVTNMIPFFGPFIGAIPGVLLYLCIEPVDALIFAAIILTVQQFDGWILGPMILGDSTGVRPIWVIFGITVGGAYFGFAGMFLGVPFTAVIVYLVNKAVEKKLSDKHIEVQ
jgi:predicted PurR-regulated permease PerM